MTDRSLDTLIDEVALGLADAEAVSRVEGMAARDPRVAALLERARARFAPLDDTSDELPIPDDLWGRVDLELDAETTEIEPSSVEIVDLAAIRRTLTRWRGTALSGIAATILLAFTLGWMLMVPVQPSVIAVLLNDRGQAIALVEGRADNTTLVTLLEQAEVPAERVMQVWTKPDDDGPPVSLGLLESGRSQTLVIDGLPAPHPEQLYEITVEPTGGSPTNLPTGPILGKGLAKAPVT